MISNKSTKKNGGKKILAEYFEFLRGNTCFFFPQYMIYVKLKVMLTMGEINCYKLIVEKACL